MMMSRGNWFGYACAAGLLLAAAGCAQIPPGHGRLAQQDIARAQLAEHIKLAREGWPKAQWWKQYGDEQLDRLIATALHDGPSLQVAAARIGSARAALAINVADQGAGYRFDAAVSRQRYSANGLLPPPIAGNQYTDLNLKVLAQDDFDWWGRNRALIAAAVGEVNARRAEYAQAEQTLAAAVAQSYFALQGGWKRMANLRRIMAVQNKLIVEQTRRIAAGLATEDRKRAAEAELAGFKQQYAALDAQCEREREALRALLGAHSTALADLAARPLPAAPAALPRRLGAELLARRPDLQAALWRVEASLDRVDAARAAFYPDINLTASFGLDALSVDKLLTAGSRTPFIAPALSLPLFSSGSLKANLGAKRRRRDELIADYNQSVFRAVREVAQDAVALRGLQKQARQRAVALHADEDLLQSVRARYRHGLADRGAVLAAELGVLRQRDGALELKRRELIGNVALIKALGGGYRATRTPERAASSK